MSGSARRVRAARPVEVRAVPATSAITTPVPAAPPAGVLRTPRLVLRPLAESDRDAYVSLLRESDDHLSRWRPLVPAGMTEQEAFERYLAAGAEGEARGTALRRLITFDAQAVGEVLLTRITRGMSWHADMSWWLSPRWTGRGLGTEAVRAVAEFAFADLPAGLGLHELLAWIGRDNRASVALALRAGFERAADERAFIDPSRFIVQDLYVRRAPPPHA